MHVHMSLIVLQWFQAAVFGCTNVDMCAHGVGTWTSHKTCGFMNMFGVCWILLFTCDKTDGRYYVRKCLASRCRWVHVTRTGDVWYVKTGVSAITNIFLPVTGFGPRQIQIVWDAGAIVCCVCALEALPPSRRVCH